MRLEFLSWRTASATCSVARSALLALLMLSPATSRSNVTGCDIKVATTSSGNFPKEPIDEASGLAAWKHDDGKLRFFVVNDSGDRARFFRTHRDGTNVEEFRITNWEVLDVEDLAIGACPKPLKGECLAIADIGDNRSRRKHIEIGFVELEKIATDTTKPKDIEISKVVRIQYPDGAQNAEAFGVLDHETAILVTKSQDRKSREAMPANVYAIDLSGSRVAKVATWDVPTWVKDKGFSALVTGLAVRKGNESSNTKNILLLTYSAAIEVVFDSGTIAKVAKDSTKDQRRWPPSWIVQERRVLRLDYLEQQEAVAYDEAGSGFFYTTEVPLGILGAKTAPIRRAEIVQCP